MWYQIATKRSQLEVLVALRQKSGFLQALKIIGQDDSSSKSRSSVSVSMSIIQTKFETSNQSLKIAESAYFLVMLDNPGLNLYHRVLNNSTVLPNVNEYLQVPLRLVKPKTVVSSSNKVSLSAP